jgi:hypothetical protein
VLNQPGTLNFTITASDPDTSVSGDKITKIELMADNGVVVTSKTFSAYNVTWSPSVSNTQHYKYYFFRVYTAGKTDGATAYIAPVWTGF